jgi:CubicO group peptidase (beta-lactamase class C family)
MSRVRPHLTAIVMLSAAALQVASPASGEDPDLRSKIEGYLEARSRDNGFSGSVLVARDGVPIFRGGYGMANLEHDVPNTPGTKFRLGSITKQFTAAAVLILREWAMLDVRETIKEYLPDCPEAWDEVTIHHLLTHTSGIPSYTDLPGYERTKRDPTTLDALIARVREKPLEFRPGERFAYSNSGYAVLGRIIEEVSGKPYGAFLAANLFEPLGMGDTGYDDPAQVLKRRASGYTRRTGKTVNADYIDMSIPHAAGALYSTVDDLLKWDRALATDQLLSRKSREAMFTPSRNRSDSGPGYGYGWLIVRAFGRPMVAHGGGIDGFACDFRRFPDDRVCVVVLSNVEGAAVEKIGNDLSVLVFGPDARPPDDQVVKVGAAAAETGEPIIKP